MSFSIWAYACDFLLQNMGIKDEFHQRNILVCIEELCKTLPPPPVALETMGSALSTTTSTPGVAVESACSLGVNYPGNNLTNNAHNLMPQSFSVLEKCGKCHKYLRGLLHQGFLCQGTFPSFIDVEPSLNPNPISIFLNELNFDEWKSSIESLRGIYSFAFAGFLHVFERITNYVTPFQSVL